MSQLMLNENQQRRIATFLHLLLEDLDQLRTYPGLAESVHNQIDAVAGCVQQLSTELGLPPRRKLDAGRRVQVTAEIWAMRSHDIGPAQLRGYGSLDADLATRLDELLGELQSQLLDLGRTAEHTRDT
jgi:hypothetical protein